MDNINLHRARSHFAVSHLIELAKSKCADLRIAERSSDRWSRVDANRSRRNSPTPDTIEHLAQGFEQFCRTARLAICVLAEVKLVIALCELWTLLEAEHARESASDRIEYADLHARLVHQLALQAQTLESKRQECEKHITRIDKRLDTLHHRMLKFYPVTAEAEASGARVVSAGIRPQLAN